MCWHGERETGINIPTHLGCWSKHTAVSRYVRGVYTIATAGRRCGLHLRLIYVGDGECFAVMRAEDRGGGTPAVVSFPLDETPRHTHSRAHAGRGVFGCSCWNHIASLSLSWVGVAWGHMPLTGTPCGEMAYGSAKQCYFDTGVRTNETSRYTLSDT